MHVVRCNSCDLMLHRVSVGSGYSARCPDCGSRVTKNSSLTLSGELAIGLAALILFFPAQLLPLITIELFGVRISTTVTSGALTLLDTFPFVGSLVLFCVGVAPLVYLLSVLASHLFLALHRPRALFYATRVMAFLRHWVMVDVFLVSLAVAGFKVTEIAEISPGSGLFSFILLQVLIAVLLSRASPKRYWDKFSDSSDDVSHTELSQPGTHVNIISCRHCGMTQHHHSDQCCRCNGKLEKRIHQSIQKTWASLIAAIIFVFPANFYPISILMTNGKRLEDTIFSGVAGLIKQGMYGIAIIIFTASIIVPVAKILCLGYILICIQFKVKTGRRQRMSLYRFVQWIGKWSMMDLCVIAIMVSLIDRGNLLNFTPGPGAVAFGLVVVLTMIAAESLDSRLIWDKHE